MNALAFDTLKLARRLEASGMSSAQSQEVAAALAEAMTEHLASRRDLEDTERRLVQAGVEGRAIASAEVLETRRSLEIQLRDTRESLEKQLQAFKTSTDATIVALRDELKGEIADLRVELRTETGKIRVEMREMELRITLRLGAIMAGSVAIFAALVKLL